jgi:hypothetical protein
MIIHLIPEGYIEEVVGSRLILSCGHSLGTIYNGGRGCDYIRKKAVHFHHLATDTSGVLVLTDFRDSKAPCTTAALHEYIWSKKSNLPKSFLCRFAVAEVESWFLADRQGLAKFLRVSDSKMPRRPEQEACPKRTLVNIARSSFKTSIRNSIVPSSGHKASVAPSYTATLHDFVTNHWDIEAAMDYSPSLKRCVQRLRELPSG